MKVVKAEEVIDVPYVVERLKKLLRKRHVIKALLGDPTYRSKVFFIAGLLGIDLIGETLAAPGSVGRVE